MSLLSSLFDKPSELARMIEESTGDMQLNTDWALNARICDCVNSGGTHAAKDAIKTIRKRLKAAASNPKTCLLALVLLEMLMKNGRAELHLEASSASFLKELEELATSPATDARVRDKTLQLIQSWADAFSAFKDELPMFDALYLRMKRQGVPFPERGAGDAVPIIMPNAPRGRAISSGSAQSELAASSRAPPPAPQNQPFRNADPRAHPQHLAPAIAPGYAAAPTMVALVPSHANVAQSQQGAYNQYQPPYAGPRPYQYQHAPPQGFSLPPHGYNPQQAMRVPEYYATRPARPPHSDPGSSWLQAAHGWQPAASSDATRSATLASLKDFISSCAAASELYASLVAAGDCSDLIQDLKVQCTSLQDRLSKTIPEIQNEELLLQALSTNDNMLAVLSGNAASATAAPATSQREGNLLGFDAASSAATTSAAISAGRDSFMDDLFGSNSANAPQVSQAPTLPPGWEILVDQNGQRYYGHPGLKVTQYEHPSLGIVQRAPQPMQPTLSSQPPPPFRQQQQLSGPAPNFQGVPVHVNQTQPSSPLQISTSASSPSLQSQPDTPGAAPVLSMDAIPDVPQPSAFGAAVSIKPPPKAAAKGPAKQVSEKKASEYAKLEDTMFEL